MFIESINFDNISEILSNELEKVNIWLNGKKITAKVKKTHYNYYVVLLNKNKTQSQHKDIRDSNYGCELWNRRQRVKTTDLKTGQFSGNTKTDFKSSHCFLICGHLHKDTTLGCKYNV